MSTECTLHTKEPNDYCEHAGDCGGSLCTHCGCCIHCGVGGYCECSDDMCGCGSSLRSLTLDPDEFVEAKSPIEMLKAQRDTARTLAVELEGRLARVEALIAPKLVATTFYSPSGDEVVTTESRRYFIKEADIRAILNPEEQP